MLEQIVNVLLGAAVASIVPLYTLVRSSKQWKLEKRLELLKARHDRLEKIYAECLQKFGRGLAENEFSSDFTSSISVYASEKARSIFNDYIKSSERDDFSKKSAYLSMAVASKEHLVDVERQIEALLT
jgi:S-adenosylmethionine:tRNA-ribosyltransferase-isomerase (queuine synthetase)